ncbi:TPA: RicAFT regulatory complex protein RicA family protein [Staphylococcus delphini]|nr:RicAFT regulatory complex protein RicA family protein [Staphylococcus delphini]HEC2147758.1 RicAFT regulatory complex protein RicA family protein [Staphylococcus delphini]HEC2159266.1 RicAFT regulatory complex protein RicA family protein [Staphylococcus delphini]HEC2169744.1 RicAFT regulatory complex protein RicA family protein [Staphylococcus delphini]HEC2184370.1 RicAFT regulatory complex protein RicA family protein [Staphylococcus delphini]
MYSREMILEAAQKLSASIQSLETIQHYQRIETQIHQNEQISQYMAELKQNQKQSVNLQNYDKPVAFARSEEKIEEIQTKINEIPIVNEFKTAQQEANDLLHFIIGTLSARIEQENIEAEDD